MTGGAYMKEDSMSTLYDLSDAHDILDGAFYAMEQDRPWWSFVPVIGFPVWLMRWRRVKRAADYVADRMFEMRTP
jgi:hypothetical protein